MECSYDQILHPYAHSGIGHPAGPDKNVRVQHAQNSSIWHFEAASAANAVIYGSVGQIPLMSNTFPGSKFFDGTVEFIVGLDGV